MVEETMKQVTGDNKYPETKTYTCWFCHTEVVLVRSGTGKSKRNSRGQSWVDYHYTPAVEHECQGTRRLAASHRRMTAFCNALFEKCKS
jgi:hypothetical protein